MLEVNLGENLDKLLDKFTYILEQLQPSPHYVI